MKTPRRPSLFVLVVALVGLLVAACTGTSEEQSSTLLLVGVQQGAQYQLALVEDQQDGTAFAERMRLIEDSRRPLPGPVVSIDLTNRATERDSAWVLTRLVSGTTVTASLHRFDVSHVDAAEGSGFVEIGTPLDLVGPTGILTEAAPNALVCPTAVQSSRTGAWLLVLDVPSDCVANHPGFPVVWLIDVESQTATALEDTNDVLGAGPYTDQRQQDERGYFLVARPGITQVYATDLTSLSADPLGHELTLEPTELVSMAGSGSLLVALAAGQLLGVDVSLPVASATSGPVDALQDGWKIVTDPIGVREHVVIIGSGQVQIQAGLGEGAPDPDAVTPSVVAADATIDPDRAYAYVLAEGAVVVADLYTGGSTDDALRSERYLLPELTLPSGPAGRPISAINWVRAADPPPGP